MPDGFSPDTEESERRERLHDLDFAEAGSYDQKRARIRRMRKSRRPEFVFVPRELLRHPPIKHRHRKTGVTPFEFALLAGVLVAARTDLSQQRHDLAWAAGGKQIEAEKADASRFQQDWRKTKEARSKGSTKKQAPAPQRRHTFDFESVEPRPNDFLRSYRKTGLPPDKYETAGRRRTKSQSSCCW